MFTTLMELEAAEASQRIAEQLQNNQPIAEALGETLRKLDPKLVMIVGRGSSDHAGVFAKYLIEIEVGVPTMAAAPSVSSIYKKNLKLDQSLVIVISQSGRSPDILAQAKMARENGAYCVALVNDETSPLCDIVDLVMPLKVGKEKSVAATKSYLATLSALLQLTANWTQTPSLLDAVAELPKALTTATEAAPQLLPEHLDQVTNLVVLGRGLGYAVTKEIALKLKEVCSIHAESFSSAEFIHGPVTLVEQNLTVLDVTINDESVTSHRDQIADVLARGANMFHLDQCDQTLHPRIAPLAVLQRFYLDVAKVALAKGFNPDEPLGLNKVTRTL